MCAKSSSFSAINENSWLLVTIRTSQFMLERSLKSFLTLSQWYCWICWWVRNPANHLNLAVYPLIYDGVYTSKRWLAGFLNHQPISTPALHWGFVSLNPHQFQPTSKDNSRTVDLGFAWLRFYWTGKKHLQLRFWTLNLLKLKSKLNNFEY